MSPSSTDDLIEILHEVPDDWLVEDFATFTGKLVLSMERRLKQSRLKDAVNIQNNSIIWSLIVIFHSTVKPNRELLPSNIFRYCLLLRDSSLKNWLRNP